MLNFHCLEHWTEFYTTTGIDLQKRFFGHFLKDEDTGWDAEPRVMMRVRHPSDVAKHEGADTWPLPKTQWTKLFLDPTSSGLATEPQQKSKRISYRSLSEGLTFVTAPLYNDVKIVGPSATKLFLSSSTSDVDAFLILRVFAPDFKEVTFSGSNDPHTPMAHGWLRASARKCDASRSLPYRPYHAHDEAQPLVPGQVYELDIEIWPTCIVVPAGYRIALTVRGKDYEYPGDLSGGPDNIGQPAKGVGPFRHEDVGDRPPDIFDNEVTLHFGAGEQPYVLLPVVGGSLKNEY